MKTRYSKPIDNTVLDPSVAVDLAYRYCHRLLKRHLAARGVPCKAGYLRDRAADAGQDTLVTILADGRELTPHHLAIASRWSILRQAKQFGRQKGALGMWAELDWDKLAQPEEPEEPQPCAALERMPAELKRVVWAVGHYGTRIKAAEALGVSAKTVSRQLQSAANYI